MNRNMDYYKQPIYSLSYRVMEALLHHDPVDRVQAVVPIKDEAD